MKRKRGIKTKSRILGFFGGLLILAASILIARFNFTSAIDLAVLDPDDWKLELVFFDSTVNNGKDALTNVNWTINGEDLAFSSTQTRTITMQVNYKNNQVNRTYEPGELQIKVPNPFASSQRSAAQLDLKIAVGANNASQTAYDWNYNYSTYDGTAGWIFTNNTPIEELANVEGSIQVVYSLTSKSETREKYEDSCVHTIETTGMKAVMNDVVISNSAETHFSRTYLHPWQRASYYITKTASKIPSLDNLGEGASNYIWVRYRFESKANQSNMGLSTKDRNNYIGLSSYQIRDKFPANVRIQDSYGVAIAQDENGYVNVMDGTTYSTSSYYTRKEIFVGYPKDTYNEAAGNLNITNTVELRGTYSDRTEEEELATATIDLDLSEFNFTYPSGNQVGLSKSFNGNTYSTIYKYPYYYQDIVRKGSAGRFNNYVSATYTGDTYDIQIGDDLIYYLDDSGNLSRMSDDDYFFSKINMPSVKNKNGATIDASKYQPSLYVRYKDSAEYVKYADYTSLGSRTVSFTEEQHVQGWYIEIKGFTESIDNANYSTDVTIKSQNLSQSGTIYNFNYVKLIINNEVKNYWSLDNYTNELTKNTVAVYDLQTYGHYLQRSWAQADWEYHDIGNISHTHYLYKNYNTASPIFDPSDESFKDYYYIYASIADYSTKAFSNMELNREQMEEKDWRHNLIFYDLLPLGMEFYGTSEDVINSAGAKYCSTNLYGKDGYMLFSDSASCKEYYKTHTTVTITKNWHNTGRTHVKIYVDYSENPFTTMNGSCSSGSCYSTNVVSFNIPYRVPYDSYAEYGRTYQNYAAIETTDYVQQSYKDSGVSSCGGAQSADINDNGSTDDYIYCAASTVNLLSATSTRQDLQTSVLTEHSGKYETDLVQSGYNEDYSYKLRVRTGANKVTNLVIYSHIEESYGDNMHWKGGFDDIDTSYAETRLDYYDNPIKVKVYWSPKVDAGSLSSDSSWQEYDEATVDKSQVHSVAFQYLDQAGNPAVMTQQFYSYVIVKMKAPSDENIHVLAYNNSHSEWNAIDNLTGQLIYDITGIDSNIVTVFLSEKFDIIVKKTWSDYGNYYNLRPGTIRFNLYKDDVVVDTKELNVAGGETEVKFENLVTADQTHYRVEEETITEYTSRFTQDSQSLDYTFTNTINRETPKFNMSAKKVWSDFDDYYKLRPEKIKFNLIKDGVVIDSKELNVAGGETEVKFEGLDALEQDSYSIVEETVAEYASRFIYDTSSHVYTFTNTVNRDEPLFDLSVKKTWADYDDYYKLRPEKIKFNLIKDGVVIGSKELDIKNGESEATFEGLKVLERDGYSVEEEEVAEYSSSFTKDGDSDTYSFTNTINREAPKPEEVPENAKTNDDGVKVFFIVDGAIFGLLTVVGATIVKATKKN